MQSQNHSLISLTLDEEETKRLSNSQFLDISWSERWKTIFSQLSQLNAEAIHFHSTVDKSTNDIVPMIVSLIGANLKQLYLSNLKLASIELIYKIQAPHLETLKLSSNLITNLRVLKKMYFPNLKKLSLKSNSFVLDISPLVEFYVKGYCQIQLFQSGGLFKHQGSARKREVRAENYAPLLKMPQNLNINAPLIRLNSINLKRILEIKVRIAATNQ